MSQVSPAIHNLAQQLLVFEATHDNAPDANETLAVRVIENIGVRLIKLAGVHGFRSLLSRALTLAKADAPVLQGVQVHADGSLKGFLSSFDTTQEAEHAGKVLLAHLLELLLVFIGESLTFQLLCEAWPNANGDANLKTEETP